MRTLPAVALLLGLALPAAAADDEFRLRNGLTGPPTGHPPVSGRPSDVLRHQATDLRMRALDARETADQLREKGREDKGNDMDDRADDLDDRAHTLDQRADDMDAQGENAHRGMVLPAPSPAMP